MHGNTQETENKIKTRDYEHVVEEIRAFAQIMKDKGEIIGGLHLESSFENITECING
jgi:3-deoxy-7-phosphoheptulonate synthase